MLDRHCGSKWFEMETIEDNGDLKEGHGSSLTDTSGKFRMMLHDPIRHRRKGYGGLSGRCRSRWGRIWRLAAYIDDRIAIWMEAMRRTNPQRSTNRLASPVNMSQTCHGASPHDRYLHTLGIAVARVWVEHGPPSCMHIARRYTGDRIRKPGNQGRGGEEAGRPGCRRTAAAIAVRRYLRVMGFAVRDFDRLGAGVRQCDRISRRESGGRYPACPACPIALVGR